MFHVSSVANRQSILAHGLDWQRMGAARGIAGSAAPEADGVFLCADEFEVQFFVNMNNTGGPVDVWQVTGIEEEHLVDSPNGFSYFPAPIPRNQVTLVEPSQDAAISTSKQERTNKKQRKKTPRSSR